MDKTSTTTLIATGIAAAAAGDINDSALSMFAVIAVGALGGAVFSLAKMASAAGSTGVRATQILWHMLGRWPLSMCFSGLIAIGMQHYLPWLQDVPRTLLLLAVAFSLAAPAELLQEAGPLWSAAQRLRGK